MSEKTPSPSSPSVKPVPRTYGAVPPPVEPVSPQYDPISPLYSPRSPPLPPVSPVSPPIETFHGDEPQMSVVVDEPGYLEFKLEKVNVSVANALRRTIISNIPTIVFKTSPYEEDQSSIEANTSRFNNEIVKHRLSMIPIHMTDLSIPLENYMIEIDVENDTDTIRYITTGDFRIKDKNTGTYLSESEHARIFPKNEQTGDHILFLRLRPKLASNIAGEKLKMTCGFSIATAKENAAFNVVSKCSYSNVIDPVRQADAWNTREQELKTQGVDATEIEFEKKNWMLLEGQRYFTPDAFHFRIKSVGVFDTKYLIKTALQQLGENARKIQMAFTSGAVDAAIGRVEPAQTTMRFGFDVVLENQDYTLGKVLEYFAFIKYFEGAKRLEFCGFQKEHPHDSHILLRFAFKNQASAVDVYGLVSDVASSSSILFGKLDTLF
jgi:DNA-directed RNA polymerase subunit L